MTDPTPTRAEVVHRMARNMIASHTKKDLAEWGASLEAENKALRERAEAAEKTNARWQRNSIETWQAMQAMRNDINECLPMPSMESDLLQGPENSVFCASVAEAVITALTAARRAEAAAWNDAIEAAALEAEWRIMPAFAASIRALRRAAPTEGAMRMETGMEHIARDIREGRFPERSEPRMRPAAPAEGEA